ncbi:PREDICTED: rRNA-processing protein FYV7-like [Amphimedon queenslandica]|uniref:Small ribosomal subunit protein mS26 n=1 Tax=Amphimedon queenslandica TaxID=400682 RepID=A0A1X7VQ05_AMPQE|nr:PREDICTED: rRNA-processing protein FYV7-like [Amphimedon queenslandica]|eukprot:XP_019859105.1 PREDICTED: rRNA-processing protein FYV7-like [Amphimedon queenslandica]
MATHVYVSRSKDCLFLFLRQGSLFQPARCYAKKYRMPQEDIDAYRKYRKEMTAQRRKYREEWLKDDKENEKLKTMRMKLDKEVEGKLYDDKIVSKNLKIDEKRKKIEEKKMEKEEQRKVIVESLRQKTQEKIKKEHIKDIIASNVEIEGFITFENLDEKISEAIDNMQISTYAIDPSGKKLSTENIYSPNALTETQSAH